MDFNISDFFKQLMTSSNPGVLTDQGQSAPVPQGIGMMSDMNQPAPPQPQQMATPQAQATASGFDWDKLRNRFGNALIAAGSPDPAHALAQLQQADRDASDATKPKTQALANGAFILTTYHDGRQEIKKNEDVAKYLTESEANKMENALRKIGYQGEVTRQNQQANADNKSASEYRPLLANSQSLLSQYDKALEIVSGKKDAEGKQISGGQGAKAQLQGLFPGIAGAVGGSEVANNKLLQSLAVDETLLNTAKTKGAISDKEMALFKSPIPSLTDDRKTVWEPWLKERRTVLEKLNKFYESEAARGEGEGRPSSGGGSKPSIENSSIPGLSTRASQYFK